MRLDLHLHVSLFIRELQVELKKFCKVAIPALFIILVGLAIYAVTLNGASQGLQYLFTVKKEYILSPNTWIQAFIQAAWSTGAGWGFIITYANYVGEEEDVPTSCLIMGLGDNLGAILSALVVIPAICALSATPEAANEALSQGNFGLTFYLHLSVIYNNPRRKIYFLYLLWITCNCSNHITVLYDRSWSKMCC